MPVISSIFLVLAMVAAVVIGTQTRSWSWGPGLLLLGCSVGFAIPALWKKGRSLAGPGVVFWGGMTVAWFSWRCLTSPVAELGQADLLLLCATVGAFIAMRSIASNGWARGIFFWGLCLLLTASLVVIFKQVQNPAFVPVFGSRMGVWPSGFASHYNETANYLIASSMMLAGAAFFSGHARWARVIWGAVAIAGVAAVWFTRSRGGIFGVSLAIGVFMVMAMVIAKRRNSRWFAPLVVLVPLLGIGLVSFWLVGWQESQQVRSSGGGDLSISGLLDNDCRLYFLGLAITGILSHPLWGGGSQSFSWECFRFWDPSALGSGSTLPVFVHNEMVQAAYDYGLVGFGLLLGLLAGVAVFAIVRSCFEEVSKENDGRDAWRVGGLAVLVGMLVQSSFSFVFHHLPGCLFLGMVLGQLSVRGVESNSKVQRVTTRVVFTCVALVLLAVIFPLGWQGTRTTQALWPSYFSKTPVVSYEARIDNLTEAIDFWPNAPSLYKNRGKLYQAVMGTPEAVDIVEPAESALKDYETVSRLHPFDPGSAIDRANLLGYLKRDAEAAPAYERAIQLQGGFEAGFRSRYQFARHLLQRGMVEFSPESPKKALETFTQAGSQIEAAAKVTPGWTMGREGMELRIRIHEAIGIAREAEGNPDAALASYQFGSALQGGNRLHYRAALLIAQKAAQDWLARRPTAALDQFLDAKNRVGKVGSQLPEGVTPEKREAFLKHLDRSIQYLRIARVQPTPK